MSSHEKGALHYVSAGILIFLLYIIQYCGFFGSYGGAAVLTLPAVIISAMFLGEWGGALIGLVTGIFMDAVSVDSFCFNTVSLFIIGCLSGLIIHYLLNNTAVASMMICTGAIFIYTLARWCIFYLVGNSGGAKYHFIHFSVPSFIITLMLSLPLYFIIRKMMKIADSHYNS